MIADRHTGVERVSSLQGEKIAMSIDTSSEAMAHIMKTMTDLYTDQELACIREYATNASDAHIEAGQTRPIEVELPGPLSPFYTVRDYGIGLTVDDIGEIYSKYGASTKRTSNSVQGMLGYGCKAALSYTPQFTVTSVKDNVRVQVAVSREANGTGSMQIVDTSTTDAGNGTIIQIPVRRENAFEKKARLFFSFWPEGSVLVNGKAPERVSGMPIGESMLVIEAPTSKYGYREDAKSYVVMGNVAYPARFPNLDLSRGYGLIAFVKMGEVNFTPSREGLMDQDPTTMETLRKVSGEFARLSPGAIQAEIDKASTPRDALSTLVAFQGMISGSRRATFYYKGRALPATANMPAATMFSARRSRSLANYTQLHELNASQWASTLWIENHDGTKFTATHKRKILQWCEANSGNHLDVFAMFHGSMPSEVRTYVDPKMIVKWADIKAEKLPSVQPTSGYSSRTLKTISGSYAMWVGSELHAERLASEIDTSKPLYFMRGNSYEARPYVRAIQVMQSDATIVTMGENRVAKFQRDFPQAKPAQQAAAEQFKAWESGLVDDVKTALAMENARDRNCYASLDADRVNDPALKLAIRIAKIDLTNVLKERKVFASIYGGPPVVGTAPNPLKNYPLLDCSIRYGSIMDASAEHVYLYINAAYAAQKGA